MIEPGAADMEEADTASTQEVADLEPADAGVVEEESPTQPIPRVKMPSQPLSTQELVDSIASDPAPVGTQKVDEEKVDPAIDEAEKVDGNEELAGDQPDSAQNYRTRVAEAELPDDVGEAVLREVDKLERTGDQSPESDDIRTWLDTMLDLPWNTKTMDSIDIQGSREVEATLRRLIEPAVADVEEGGTAKVDSAAADSVNTDRSPAGPDDDDTVEAPAVLAGLSGREHPRPQLPEQQVVGPVLVETPTEKWRFRSLALAATALAVLLIGALLFAAGRDRGVTAQSAPTVTATATATVSKPTNEPSDESTGAGAASPIQLRDLPESGRASQTVQIKGRFRGGPDTFLRVQRWEGGKWLDYPLITKTDKAGRFTAYVEPGGPGRYQLRVLDPNSLVTSDPFVLVIKG